jgi:uncharacterized protein (TIGR03067 family)
VVWKSAWARPAAISPPGKIAILKKFWRPGSGKNWRMKKFVAILLLAGCATLNEQSMVVGRWRCLSATIDGKPVGEKKASELRLTITRDRYKTEDSKEVLFESVYSLDASTTPAHLSLTGTEGDLTGKKARGILEVSGDLLVLCYTMPEKPAPVAFQSPPGSGAYLTIWKREK